MKALDSISSVCNKTVCFTRYNRRYKQAAQVPVLGSVLGCVHIIANIGSLLSSIKSLAIKSLLYANRREPANQFALITAAGKVFYSIREIGRGFTLLIPFLPLICEDFFLSPAQRMAYKVDAIYQNRLGNYDSTSGIDDLKDVDIKNGNYSPEFIDFINSQPAKMSTNQEKIDQFVKLFKDCKLFENDIFSDRALPFYALAAFSKGRIDREDMATVLELFIGKICYGDDFQICPILTKNKYSKDAKKYLLCSMEKKKRFVPSLSNDMDRPSDMLEKLQQLPAYKRFFFHHSCPFSTKQIDRLTNFEDDFMAIFNRLEFDVSQKGRLEVDMLTTGLIKNSDGRAIHLTVSTDGAALKARYGKEGVPNLPKLGKFKPLDIVTHVMRDDMSRLCATYFPGINCMGLADVHDSHETPTNVIAHDKAHALIMHRYPSFITKLMFDHIAAFQELTGKQMSREIWYVADFVAFDVLNMEEIERNPKNPAFYFKIFTKSSAERPDDYIWRQLFFEKYSNNFSDSVLTPFGCLMVIRMFKNTEKWKTAYGFDPNQPGRCIRNIFDIGMKYQKLIDTKEDTKVKIWKMQQLMRGKKDFEVKATELKFVKRTKAIGNEKNMVALRRI